MREKEDPVAKMFFDRAVLEQFRAAIQKAEQGGLASTPRPPTRPRGAPVKKPANPIVRFLHCLKCIEHPPAGASPATFTSYSVGLTEEGRIAVWCRRHNEIVCALTLADPPTLPACDACGEEL